MWAIATPTPTRRCSLWSPASTGTQSASEVNLSNSSFSFLSFSLYLFPPPLFATLLTGGFIFENHISRHLLRPTLSPPLLLSNSPPVDNKTGTSNAMSPNGRSNGKISSGGDDTMSTVSPENAVILRNQGSTLQIMANSAAGKRSFPTLSFLLSLPLSVYPFPLIIKETSPPSPLSPLSLQFVNSISMYFRKSLFASRIRRHGVGGNLFGI